MDRETSTKPGRTGTAGSLYWQVSVTGTARSPGARWDRPVQSGVSAIEKLPVVIQSLLALEQHYNTKAEDTKATMAPFSLVIGKVAGGHYETVTASRVQMRGSVYFQPDVGSVIDVMDNFRRAVTSSAEADAFLCVHKPRCSSCIMTTARTKTPASKLHAISRTCCPAPVSPAASPLGHSPATCATWSTRVGSRPSSSGPARSPSAPGRRTHPRG